MTVKCAHLYFELGSYLQTAFKIWSFSKQRDEITGTWNQFLASTFGISGSYSRQLRKVSKKLGGYERLYSVTIPFSELYRRTTDIQLMLEGDDNLADIWSRPITARTETNMSH